MIKYGLNMTSNKINKKIYIHITGKYVGQLIRKNGRNLFLINWKKKSSVEWTVYLHLCRKAGVNQIVLQNENEPPEINKSFKTLTVGLSSQRTVSLNVLMYFPRVFIYFLTKSRQNHIKAITKHKKKTLSFFFFLH